MLYYQHTNGKRGEALGKTFYWNMGVRHYIGKKVRITLLDLGDGAEAHEGVLEIGKVNPRGKPEVIGVRIDGEIRHFQLAGVDTIEEI